MSCPTGMPWKSRLATLLSLLLLAAPLVVAGAPAQAEDVPNPHFRVNPVHNQMSGWGWTEDAELDIEITPGEGASYETDWETDEFGTFDLDIDPSEFDIEAGDVVTVDDGATTKTHTVTALVVTNVDTDANTVSGWTDSQVGSEVEVFIYPHREPYRQAVVGADGVWEADFSTAIGTDPGEQAYDIQADTTGGAEEYDGEGDATFADWRVPNPHFNVDPHHNGVWGHEWPIEVELEITSDRGGNPAQTEWTDESGNFWLDLWEVWEIEAGDQITVTHDPGNGEMIVKTHTVTSLTVDPVTPGDPVVTGVADETVDDMPGQVRVEVHGTDEELWRLVDVDAGGTWSVDFSDEPTEEHMGEGTIDDFDEHAHGNANQRDADGDATFADWRVPKPHINANPQHNDVWGDDWPTEVELEAVWSGAPDDPVTTQTNEWGNFGLEVWDTWDITAADEITVTYNTDEIVRTLTVSTLDVTDVDLDTSVVSGIADYGHDTNEGTVQVEVHSPDWAYRLVEVEDDGEGGGTWTADFTTEPDEGMGEGTVSLDEHSHGNAHQRDDQHNATWTDWRIPNPRFAVNWQHNNIAGWDWEPGSEATITFGDPVEHTVSEIPVSPWGDFWTEIDHEAFDIQQGQLVTVTDGVSTKDHVVTDLTVDGVNPADHDTAPNQVFGTAEPLAWVEVHVHHEDPPMRRVQADGDGSWVADFDEAVDDHGEGWGERFDLVLGTRGAALEFDEDDDATEVPWGVPNPHFNVGVHDGHLWGHEWPEGATLTVEVNDTVLADDVVVFSDWEDHWGPGDFSFEFDVGAIVAEDVVTVSSDDPAVSKTHTVTALEVTEIDTDADTVSGTTDTGEGSVEVHAETPEGWRMRHAEVQPDGTWMADFSVDDHDDHGEGWGDTADLRPGVHGSATERDDDDDATFVGWHVANPRFWVNTEYNAVWGNEWPADVTLDVHIATGNGAFDGEADTNEWGDFWRDIDPDEFDIEPGDIVSVSHGDVTKTHTITNLRDVVADADTHTVSGLAEPDSWVWVSVDWPDHAERLVQAHETTGEWEADFSVEGSEDWEQTTVELVPGSHGGAEQRDEDDDATHRGWQIANPHFRVNPATNGMWGHEWPAEVTLDVTITGGSPDPYETTAATDEDGDFGLHAHEFDILPGQSVTVSHDDVVKTHVVTALEVTEVNPVADTVSGITDENTMDVHVSAEAGDHGGEWLTVPADELVDLGDGVYGWTADFAGIFDIDPDKHGHAYQEDADGDATWMHWNIYLLAVEVSPTSPSVPVGLTQQFEAAAVMSLLEPPDSGSAAPAGTLPTYQVDVTDHAEWSVEHPSFASIDETGLAEALSEGTTDITASYHGEVGAATLTVTPAEVTAIEVTPPAAEIEIGETETFAATATYTDDSTADVTAEADWDSSDDTIATVSDTGVATGVAEGTATISATYEDESGHATLTVTAPVTLDALVVTPTEATVAVGATQAFTATAVFSNEAEIDATEEADWTSSNTAIATVSDDGVATGVAEGSATITATYEDETGSATLTVTEDVEPPEDRVERFAGEDRIMTAILISQDTFANAGGPAQNDGRIAADSVVLARSTDFADALAGTPLAVEVGAPILLTPSANLDPRVAAEIQRILPAGGTVHLLGGTAALREAVQEAVVGMGYVPNRIAGATRIETAIEIARVLDRDTVLVTTGFNFPDALAAGAAAAATDGAVLLTTSGRPHPAVDAYLDELANPTVFAVGGPAATAYPAATAVSGPTREHTAVEVAETFFDDPSRVGIARRDGFADALAGGAHIGRHGGPLLLTLTGRLHEVPEGYLCANADSIHTAYVYGGTAAVSAATADAVLARITGEGCDS